MLIFTEEINNDFKINFVDLIRFKLVQVYWFK